jgi:hypothetical protein
MVVPWCRWNCGWQGGAINCNHALVDLLAYKPWGLAFESLKAPSSLEY